MVDPTPAEAAVLAETLEQLLLGFDDQERQIVTLALQQYSILVPRSAPRWGGRVVQRVRNRLERMRCEAPED